LKSNDIESTDRKISGNMIRTKAQLSKSIAILAASLVVSTGAFASIVYDNTTNPLNRVVPQATASEIGDQIFLAGADRRVTDFQFNYFVSTNASGNERAEFFFYDNSGIGGAPGVLLFRSGEFNLLTGNQTATAPALSVAVPNTFTWSVAFRGIDFNETAGLLLFNPPSTGASFDDFWVRNSDGTWSTFLIDAGATPANFGARVTAVPEPSTFALALIGGTALLGYRRFRRKS
jgi:hypothetical protein